MNFIEETQHKARIQLKMEQILTGERKSEFFDSRTGDPRFTALGEEVMNEECEDPRYADLDEIIYFETSVEAFKTTGNFHV